MKIGISYNLFDGEELLEGSINTIRDDVDYISIVYQTISNFGAECSPKLLPILKKLKEKGLIDDLFEYKPHVSMGGAWNEINKRNIGVNFSLTNRCSHHMAMDADEYYLKNEFKYMKKIIEEGHYDSAACKMMTYYKSWEYQLDPPEDYYVSLLFKIDENKEYIHGHPFPVEVDPTRRMTNKNCKIFSRDEIEMHHGSFIREDISIKLENSSAKAAFSHIIPKITQYYEKWKYPEEIMWACGELLKVKKVKNLFSEDCKIAVILHLFYNDMWEDIKYYLNSLKEKKYELYVNLVDGYYDPQIKQTIKKFKENTTFIISPNKGEDIGGFLQCYKHINNDIDFILKIHTKKSIGTTTKPSQHVIAYGKELGTIKGREWFHQLMRAVLKNTQQVNNIINELSNGNNCGMVGLDKETYLGPNINLVKELANYFSLPLEFKGDRLTTGNFVGGNIFWVNNSILKKYLTPTNITYLLNTLPENYHNEPSYNHAMERIFGLMVKNENKKINIIH